MNDISISKRYFSHLWNLFLNFFAIIILSLSLSLTDEITVKGDERAIIKTRPRIIKDTLWRGFNFHGSVINVVIKWILNRVSRLEI